MKGILTKKGGLSWKKRYFVVHDRDNGSKIVYYAKEGDSKIRGEVSCFFAPRTWVFQIDSYLLLPFVSIESQRKPQHFVIF